jgi:hypothetical protein
VDEKNENLLPVLSKESDHPCFECAKCCKYVAIEIDTPTTMKEYDYIVWYLYHRGIEVFVDFDDAWFVKFDSTCEHLGETGLCGVYETRPFICRDFDWRECENHLPPDEAADKYTFRGAGEFLAWLEGRRPKAFQRYMAWQKRKRSRGEEPELVKRVKITDILPAPASR